jgi:hypothetical protein
MKEAPDSSETSVLTRATRRNNPEDTILQHLKEAASYDGDSAPREPYTGRLPAVLVSEYEK